MASSPTEGQAMVSARGGQCVSEGRPQLQARDRRPTPAVAIEPHPGYPRTMSKTSVEIDRDIASEAAAILGTTTLRDTIDASLREIVNAKRRIEFIALLQDSDHYDFDTIEHAWGGKD